MLITSFLLLLFTTSFFCLFSRKGTPWCFTTGLMEQFETMNEIRNIYNSFFMNDKYIHIYNNLINFTRNKELYKHLNRPDNFSDRLTLFLLHFSFFLKNFKKDENKKILQEIYDFNFRQLELSIREIGYGDQSINKKMKDYINVFHAIVSDIHFWDDLEDIKRKEIISKFFKKVDNIFSFLE